MLCAVIASLPGKRDELRWVWLSHQRDLRVDNAWLLVDDFSGPVLSPNLGAWGTFDNARGGGTAKVAPLAPSGPVSERVLAWDFNLGTGGYQYCGLEWSGSGWTGLGFADKIRYRAKAAQKTVIDFHLVQSDIGDDNYFGVLDTVGTAWKAYQHDLKDFRGRLGNRSGTPDPTKGTAFRWHIQYDKNPTALTGTVTLDEFLVGGNLAQMYTAPEPAVPRTGNPPIVVLPRAGRSHRPQLFRRGRQLEFHTTPLISVRWLDLAGRVQGRSRSDASGLAIWTAPSSYAGVVLVEAEGGKRAAAGVLFR